jgi:NAD+ kinase
VKRIGLLYHPLKEAAYTLAKEIQGFLNARDIANWLCSAWEDEEARTQANETDLILCIGGDGTILRAVQAAVPHQTPITGINLGNLGFMTELSAAEALDRLPDLLAGKGWIDERAMLEAELLPKGGKHEMAQVFCALNDVVVTREAIARVVYIEASVDGRSNCGYSYRQHRLLIGRRWPHSPSPS